MIPEETHPLSSAKCNTCAAEAHTLTQDAAPVSLQDIIETLVDFDDENFSADLLALTVTTDLVPHSALLDDPRIIDRLCACTDSWFGSTLLGLAQPDHEG